MPKENANELVQDVFISYAHADDKIPHGAESGWVTTFVDQLKGRLGFKLGVSEPHIWMDWQLAANDQVTETLLDTIRRSRTLVLFMSRGYSRSQWCQRELGKFLDINKAHKNKESVFIVELDRTERENWHPGLQELTPIRLYRVGRDNIPQLLGIPVPKPDQDDPYWINLTSLVHLISHHLETRPYSPVLGGREPGIVHTIPSASGTQTPPPPATVKPIIWIAEPTDDVIDEWEALAEAIRQAGAGLRPLGLDTYPRSSESEFRVPLRADLGSAHLFVQLLGQAPGRRPKDGKVPFTALQSAIAGDLAKQQQLAFLQWRSRDIKLENVTDEGYRQLITGAIACGFEEFRQRVLTAVQNLSRPSPAEKLPSEAEGALAICISANKSDRDLSLRVRDILVDLGADALTAPTEPTPDQTPTDFNAQLDEVMNGSEGVIIVYGQTAPAWVQAQYVRARKALAQQRKGVWGALLDGPPRDKPDAGVASRNLDATPLHSPGAAPISPASSTNTPTSEGKSYETIPRGRRTALRRCPRPRRPRRWALSDAGSPRYHRFRGREDRDPGRRGRPRVDLERARREPRAGRAGASSSTRARSGPAARWAMSSRMRNGAASGVEERSPSASLKVDSASTSYCSGIGTRPEGFLPVV